MSVLLQLEKDFSQALKSKDQLAVLALRQIKTALTNAEIANSRKALSDDQVVKVLKSEVKKRKESAELYIKGGRNELAEKEKKEIEVIKKYLPEEISEEVIKSKIAEVIEKLGAASPTDMGKVMGAAIKELGTGADGSVVSRLVKEALN